MRTILLGWVLLSAAIAQGIGGTAGMGGKAGFGGGASGGGGGSPSYVTGSGCSAQTNPAPATCSLGTLNIGDIVDYGVWSGANGATFTMTLTGSCAATGGNVTDIASTNQGTATGSGQKGHFVITTGGACTLSGSWAGGATEGAVVGLAIRSATAVDKVNATFNSQSNPGTGANIITSGTALSTTNADFCVATTADSNQDGGTLTAGTTIAWTLGSHFTSWPGGNEYFIQSVSGSIQATFGITTGAYSLTGQTCYY